MIDLYYYTSPNARKILIALEELGLPYEIRWTDITARRAVRSRTILRVNPNGKIPAIVDHDGPGGRPIALFESAAILLYLAEKTGRLLPEDPAAALGGDLLDGLAGRQPGADGRAGRALRHLRPPARDDRRLRATPLPAPRRARSTASWRIGSRSGVPRRSEYLDRRHRLLPVDPGAARATGSPCPTTRPSRRGSDRISARPSAQGEDRRPARGEGVENFRYTAGAVRRRCSAVCPPRASEPQMP